MASPAAPAKAADALPRRSWFEDRIDRLLFLLFFVGGFALILFIKLAGRALFSFRGEPIEPRLLAALAAMGLLLLYAFLASRTAAFRLHPERLGDNCYYLGLLYTLASLVAALIELERVAPEQRGALIESLLAAFGVALASTILGIALRVWFVQMRREIEDLDAELQRDLQEAAQKLEDQLLFAVTELESFRLRTQQVLHERLEQSTSAFTASAERQAAAVEEACRRVTAALGETLAPLRGEVGRLRETAAAVADALAGLVARIAAVEVPRDLVSAPARRLGNAVERLTQSVERLEAAGERRARAFDEEIERTAQRLAALAGALEELAARLAGAAVAAPALQSLARESEPARARLADLGKTLEQLLAAAREDAREVRSLRDQIRADLAEYHRLQKELGAGLAEVAETIVKRLEA